MNPQAPLLGVLGLQGAFREHLGVLASLGVPARKVTRPEHLEDLDGVILPGGESTAMVRLAAGTGLFPVLRERLAGGLPALGTCAGLILLADRLTDDSLSGFDRPGGLDITVSRNAYGAQRESFVAPLEIGGFDEPLAGTFIRAPQIVEIVEASGVEVLARHEGRPVLVRQGAVWAASFHPELGTDTRLHEAFLAEIRAPRAGAAAAPEAPTGPAVPTSAEPVVPASVGPVAAAG